MRLNLTLKRLLSISILFILIVLSNSCSDNLFNTENPKIKFASNTNLDNKNNSADQIGDETQNLDQIKDRNDEYGTLNEEDSELSSVCEWLNSNDSQYSLANIANAPNFDPQENIIFLKDLITRLPGYTSDEDFYNFTFLTYQVYNSKVAPDDIGEWLTSPNQRSGVHNRANYIRRGYALTINNAKSSQCKVEFQKISNNEFVNPGCFDENTLITMADGSQKAIKYIRKDDEIYNPVLKQAFKVKSVIAGGEEKPMIRIGYNNLSVLVTYNHPFLTDKGLKFAENLTQNDLILDQNGDFVEIETLETAELKVNQVVWNIELDAISDDPIYHMVEANGIVSGDLFLQNQLTKQTK